MIKACIFDLDGTLVNSVFALQRSTNLTLADFGLSPISEEETKRFVGDGYKKLMERALAAHGEAALRFYEESLPLYMEHFSKESMYRLAPYEGILELLDFLKEAGIKTAVFSNKPHAQAVENVKKVFGEQQFDLILGQKEGTPVKPDPTGLFQILKELQVQVEECLYFGDTNTDMRTGKAAGVQTVGVLWGFRTKEELAALSPQYLVSEPKEVIEILKKLLEFHTKL